VEVTLVADELPDRDEELSQVWSVHPTGEYAKEYPQVEGHILRLSARNAKLRREGYRKREPP
jgi:hypothetical protein